MLLSRMVSGLGRAVMVSPGATMTLPMAMTWLADWLSGSRPGTLEVAQLVPEVRDTSMPRSSSLFIISFHLCDHMSEP